MTIPAIAFTVEQIALIDRLCPNPAIATGALWSDDRAKDLRVAIKSFYVAAQATKCCYCDRHLGSDNHRVWDIDHIVPRGTHPWFMFEPLNLAATCPDCNIAKRAARVLKNNARKTYPKKPDDFLLLHPHFDDFEEHILRHRLIYIAKTEKGKRTIYACDLLRFAQRYIDWSGSVVDDRFEAEVDTVLEGGPKAADLVRTLARILPP